MEYSSIQLIKVKNTTLAMIYYAVMVLVIVYIAYSLFSTSAYQFVDPLVSNTFVKMKGSAHTKSGVVWDQYDMVVPPILPDTVFIGTNFILTPNQTQTECPGVDAKLEICNCSAHAGNVTLCCPAETHTENGMFTGECSSDGIHCQMKGWCPFEVKPTDKDENVLIGVEEWTLFARINGHFPHWKESVANTQSNPPMDHPNGLTLFDLQGVVTEADQDWDDMKYKGGIILASFNYECNLDKPASECEPTVSFERLDDPTDPVSSGFNFRYIHSTRDLATDTVTRDLWKLYGIYIVFQVFGVGGRFDAVTLLTYLGAMAAYFSMSTVVCDFVLQYFLPNRDKLMAHKFRDVHMQAERGDSMLSDTLL